MNVLVLVALLQVGPSADGPTPHHVLQCEDATKFAAALEAAGVRADAEGGFRLPTLSCGVASGPPGARRYACTQPAVKGATAERLFLALVATGIEPVAATMQAVYAFSDVRCRQTKLGLECTMTNEMQQGSGDLRGDKVVKRRSSCK